MGKGKKQKKRAQQEEKKYHFMIGPLFLGLILFTVGAAVSYRNHFDTSMYVALILIMIFGLILTRIITRPSRIRAKYRARDAEDES